MSQTLPRRSSSGGASSPRPTPALARTRVGAWHPALVTPPPGAACRAEGTDVPESAQVEDGRPSPVPGTLAASPAVGVQGGLPRGVATAGPLPAGPAGEEGAVLGQAQAARRCQGAERSRWADRGAPPTPQCPPRAAPPPPTRPSETPQKHTACRPRCCVELEPWLPTALHPGPRTCLSDTLLPLSHAQQTPRLEADGK